MIEWSDQKLATLPSKNGFRQRGMDMTRLETFTDAAFAFAVTLLVVGGGDSVPSNFDELISALKQVPAFAASFANIMMFWYAHHVWSRRFGIEDLSSVFLSLLLIFITLIYVYPLKAIYSGAFWYFSNGYLASFFDIGSMENLRQLFTIFGIGYAALATVIVLLNRHALSIAAPLSLNDREVFSTHTEIQFWFINLAVAVTSVLLATLLPDKLVVVAGMIYSIFAVVLPWHGARRSRAAPA
jgi:uncharacterized membrane protein